MCVSHIVRTRCNLTDLPLIESEPVDGVTEHYIVNAKIFGHCMIIQASLKNLLLCDLGIFL